MDSEHEVCREDLSIHQGCHATIRPEPTRISSPRKMNIRRDKSREFDILLENSPLGIVLTDTQNRFIYVNPSFRNMLGYTEQEILSMDIASLTHPDSVAVSKNAIKEVFNSKGPVTIEKQYLHKSGSVIDANTRIAAVYDKSGNPLYQCTNVENITDKKVADQKLVYQATHDNLTGLINRYEFERRVEQLINTARDGEHEHVICFMDLDQFKVVNDTCGHIAGDELLRQLSGTINSTLREGDSLARLGGDEFGLLLQSCEPEHASQIAETILDTVRNFRFIWDGKTHNVSISIGMVLITKCTTAVASLLSDADIACYLAKDMGRNRVQVYHAEDSVQMQRRGEMHWVATLNNAMDKGGMCLFAQPIVSVDSPDNVHYEILVRLEDEKGGLVLPGTFLPVAEKYSLITKLDRWVVEQTLSGLAKNPLFYQRVDFVSINLSGISLADPDFLQFVVSLMAKNKIEGSKICFEITETAAISNLSMAITFITTVKELGCLFALDDFGTGLSSFGYLKNLPVDILKIDGLFVKDIADDPIDRAMVKSINEIGHVMGMKTIAEFVENDVIKDLLNVIGVDYLQGYGIGKPVPLSDLLD